MRSWCNQLADNSSFASCSNIVLQFLNSCTCTCTLTLSAYGPSLRQCITRQGLDSFLSLYRRAKPVCPALRLLKIEGAAYTVFAPDDSAFDAISDQLESLTSLEVCSLLLGHIVSRSFEANQLFNGMRLTSLAGTGLFVTRVQHFTPVDENRELVQQVMCDI